MENRRSPGNHSGRIHTDRSCHSRQSFPHMSWPDAERNSNQNRKIRCQQVKCPVTTAWPRRSRTECRTDNRRGSTSPLPFPSPPCPQLSQRYRGRFIAQPRAPNPSSSDPTPTRLLTRLRSSAAAEDPSSEGADMGRWTIQEHGTNR